MIPVETRCHDYHKVMNWASNDGISLEALTFLDNLERVLDATISASSGSGAGGPVAAGAPWRADVRLVPLT